MARTYPLTRSDGGFRPQQHQRRTQRHGQRLFQIHFSFCRLISSVPISQSHRAPGVGQRIDVRGRLGSGAVHEEGPNPVRVRPLCALVWQFVVGDVVGPRRPGPDDFGFITIVAVPGLNMKDFVATRHEPADIVLAKVQCGAKGWRM